MIRNPIGFPGGKETQIRTPESLPISDLWTPVNERRKSRKNIAAIAFAVIITALVIHVAPKALGQAAHDALNAYEMEF